MTSAQSTHFYSVYLPLSNALGLIYKNWGVQNVVSPCTENNRLPVFLPKLYWTSWSYKTISHYAQLQNIQWAPVLVNLHLCVPACNMYPCTCCLLSIPVSLYPVSLLYLCQLSAYLNIWSPVSFRLLLISITSACSFLKCLPVYFLLGVPMHFYLLLEILSVRSVHLFPVYVFPGTPSSLGCTPYCPVISAPQHCKGFLSVTQHLVPSSCRLGGVQEPQPRDLLIRYR